MIIFIALMMGFSPAYAAQDYSRRLDSVLESLKKHLAEKKPEFTDRSIEPIKFSRNVSVNNWESQDRGVRVSIIAYGSEEEAAAAHPSPCHFFLNLELKSTAYVASL